MHDLDRTQAGYGESEFFGPEPGGGGVFSPAGGVFSEEEQMNLAGEMMEIQSEEEFEQFLGDLISKGVQAIGSFVPGPAGQALGGILKGAAKHLLPIAGRAIGGMMGGPLGAALGGSFEAEMEAEQQEWEAANTFVKMAGEAVKNAAAAPPNSNPVSAAHNAVVESAKMHAPDIVPALTNSGAHMHAPQPNNYEPSSTYGSSESYGNSGRWVRHGRRIILHGI